MCVRACVRACVSACVCVCVRVREGEKSELFSGSCRFDSRSFVQHRTYSRYADSELCYLRPVLRLQTIGCLLCEYPIGDLHNELIVCYASPVLG